MSLHLDETRPLPYCPGCGHPHVLRALDDALARLAVPAGRVVIVTDIGCVGLADPYFPGLHTVHTLHGRSVAVAAGIRMGSRETDAGPLKVIVLIGDGGAGIGLLHLVHAAQTNVDITVIVHNNLVYGMTGGQHSVLTLPGMKTTTTPDGCPIPPLDLQPILAGAGGGFFARTVAPGDDVTVILGEAIAHHGFACVEVMELCPTFATMKGGVTGATLRRLPGERGLSMGITRNPDPRPAFLSGPRPVASVTGPALSASDGVVPEPSWGRLDRTAQIVLAGRAGERVQSAALLAASAACAAGLSALVRTDNPVTQGTGFSFAELTVSPQPIDSVALPNPDLLIALSPEGLREVAARGLLRPPGAARRILLDAELPPADGGPIVERQTLRKRFGAKGAALGALVCEIDRAGWWDRRAWQAAIARLPAARRTEAARLLDETR